MATWKKMSVDGHTHSYAASSHSHAASDITSGTIATTYTAAKVTSVSGSTGAVGDGDIDHNSLANFASNEHYTQASIIATGALASGSIASGFTTIATARTAAKCTDANADQTSANTCDGQHSGVTGAILATTLNTGQGANELYDMNQNVKTDNDVQFGSLGVGTAGSGTSGEGRFTNEVTAYYSSDVALKTNINPISNPLDKLLSIGGYNFDWKAKVIKDRGGEDGFFVRKKDVGILAQEIEKVIPEIVVTRKDGTKAVKYEKIVPLLIESIKELTAKVTRLENGNK